MVIMDNNDNIVISIIVSDKKEPDLSLETKADVVSEVKKEIFTPVIKSAEQKLVSAFYFFAESKEEAKKGLHDLFLDEKLFAKLSEQTQKKIVFLFKDEFIQNHTEDYALGLLYFLNK